MQTLYALDLTQTTGSPAYRWRRNGSFSELGSATASTAHTPELPCAYCTSILGYHFAAAESWTNGVPRLRVEFCGDHQPSGLSSDRTDEARDVTPSSSTVRTRLKLPWASRSSARRSALPLTLEINHEMAKIGVAEENWKGARASVLLAVAQFWRFGAIDQTLDELLDWARADLAATERFRSIIRTRRVRELRARYRALQRLILDLPDFEAALTNPRSCLAPGSPLRLYRALAVKLGLYRWRREIDERVEVVEAILDSRIESLNHYQSLAFQIALELIIVAVLLLDAGLFLADVIAKR
jgi:hypothetical protein